MSKLHQLFWLVIIIKTNMTFGSKAIKTMKERALRKGEGEIKKYRERERERERDWEV